jgi:hypothetical protein
VRRRLLLAGALVLPALGVRLAFPTTRPVGGVLCVAAIGLGLLLLRPVLTNLTDAGIADTTLLLCFYATVLWREAVLAETLGPSLCFILATAALVGFWTHRRALGGWGAALVLLVLVGLAFEWRHPRLLETLFGSRGGLLFWNPLFWCALPGGLRLARREPRGAFALAAVVFLVLAANPRAALWVVLPVLIVGVALALEGLRNLAARRPGLVLATAGYALAAWNVLLMAQYAAKRLPADETVSFVRVAENSAAILSESVGSPLAWPANWLFAARYRVSPGEFDLRSGKRIFTSPDQATARVAAGDPHSDPALFSDGWTSARPCENTLCRSVMGSARLFVPLEAAEPLSFALRARGTGALLVAVNGVGVGGLVLTKHLTEQRLQVPASRLRRGQNEVALRVEGESTASLEQLVLERQR